jgi:thiamine-phosphate pyrophosphorylase
MGTLGGFPNPPAPGSGERSSPAPTRSRPPRLYIVTDRAATGNRPLVEVVTRALGGIAGSGLAPGDVAVQLREKDLGGRALVELARPLRDVTAAAGVALYVNDRIDVALAVGADGVHLGGTSLTPADVRVLAPALAIGVSAHRIADVEAGAGQASFAVFGPIRDTPSKRALGQPVGLEPLAEAARLPLPLLAIGGIDAADTVAEVVAAGAHGVACIRAIMEAADPAQALQSLAVALASRARKATGKGPSGAPYRT